MALHVKWIFSLLLFLSTTGSVVGWYWRNGGSGEDFTGQDHHFHCDRFNQGCKNGGECYGYDNGECYCPDSSTGEEFFGYDCSMNVTGFPNDDAVWDGCPCQNIDYCYRGADGETLFCACPPDYFGDDCSKNRVSVECSADFMIVKFNPIENFTGIAYFGNDSEIEQCQMNTDEMEEGYRLTRYISFNGQDNDPCNMTVSTSWNGDYMNTSYTRQLTIQYDPLLQSGLDLIIDVTCVHLENGTWVAEGVFGAARDSNVQKGKEIQSTYFPVTLGVWGPDENWGDAPSGDPVFLGQYVHLFIKMTTLRLYSRIMVKSCTFSNSIGDKSITVIEDNCPTDRSQGMAMDVPEYHDGDEGDPFIGGDSYGIRYKFRAIRFGNDPVVRISCRIRMCKEGDSACAQRYCNENDRKKRDVEDVDEGMRKRKKRQATGSSENEGTISNAFRIIDPYEESERAFQVTAEECMKQSVVKTVGISFIVALLALIIVCIGLVLYVCRLRFARRELALKLRYTKEGPFCGRRNDGFQNDKGDNLDYFHALNSWNRFKSLTSNECFQNDKGDNTKSDKDE